VKLVHLVGFITKKLAIDSLPPIPVAARSESWDCGFSLAGMVGSNLAGVMEVCLV